MSILNEPELNASFLTNIPDNIAGLVSPADIRGELVNILESLQSYGGVVSDGVVLAESITTTPAKWTNFSTNNTGPNQLLQADAANDKILVFEPALYFTTLRFFGKWPATEDLRFQLYVNGAPNPITPVSFAKEGAGAADPQTVSVTDIAFIVNSTMIAAGPGGTQAEVELYLSSDSGTFNLDQDDITLGMEYNPLSIRTVG